MRVFDVVWACETILLVWSCDVLKSRIEASQSTKALYRVVVEGKNKESLLNSFQKEFCELFDSVQ